MQVNINHLPSDLGQTLAELRTAAGLKQTDIAQRLNVDQSRVSRIEKGNVTPTSSEIEGYLSAIGTEDGEAYRQFLKLHWKHLERPSFWHPERDALCKTEISLQKLENFKSQPKISKQQINEAELYGDTLRREAQYLIDLNHSIAFIGKNGVGKTTAVCKLTGLINPQQPQFDRQSLLATNTSRTTVCEVSIRSEKQFGLIVHPLSVDEINKVIEDFWAVWKDCTEEDREDKKNDVAWEIERALRNMIKAVEGNTESEDPLAALVNQCDSLPIFRSEIFDKLKLSERKQVEFWFNETSEQKNREEFKKKFQAINYSRDKELPLPQRIDVMVPDKIFESSPYNLEIVDTRGVEVEGTAKGTVLRQDLIKYLDDPRTLSVLCCKFGDAPGDVIYSFIDNLSQTRQEAFKERVVILVLVHNNDALKTRNDFGDYIDTEGEAYKIEDNKIRSQIRKLQQKCSTLINMPILFLNASSEDSRQVAEELNKQLENLRYFHVQPLLEAVDALDVLIKNVEEKNAQLARKNVLESLKIFLEQNPKLPVYSWRIQDEYLFDEMKKTHPRKVLATVRRDGKLDSFNVYDILANGSRNIAWHSSKEPFYGLNGIINNLLGNPELKPTHNFLKQIKSNWSVWREDFLKYSEQTGKQVFQYQLEYYFNWAECAAMYGQKGKFRDQVIAKLEEWFDDPEQRKLHNLLKARIEKAWEEKVLAQLKKLTDESLEAE
ncbi:helix-turn-helix domain-containing protein [Aerosakkonema funiforme]|uniref:helix-turn-helix domain-containing protein n=1 Tax=Aerosakkonema funiforme TaxID=1246630 RepID=UPI0035B83056